MKHWIFSTMLAIIFASQSLLAEVSDPQAVFASANQQYEAAEYEAAIADYLTLLPDHQSASLHYNLGNVYYQLGDYGPAILHYEKALALDPRNPDIRANLELTQEAAQLTPPSPSWYSVVANQASVNFWASLLACSFWGAIALFVIAPMYRWRGPLRGGLIALASIGLLVSSVAMYGWHINGGTGVMLSDNAKLNVAPTASSPIAGSVKAGQQARIQKQHGEYYLVTLDDKVGWVSQSEFSPIWD